MQQGQTPVLEFQGLNMEFRQGESVVKVLREINLQVREGEFLALVGSSGCGKSTLLRLISGLEPPTSGRVLFHGKEIKGVNQSVGFVTQDSNLFPWLTLFGNIAFPLRVAKVDPAEQRERVMSIVKQVGLEGFEQAYPHQLSGGMQKRASIARTLIYQPEVLLMDEPFSALDAQTRLIMQQDLLNLWSASKRTVVFVTHDLNEAVGLADRIVILGRNPGHVKRSFDVPLGRPRDLTSLQTQPEFQDAYHEIWDYFKTEVGSYRAEETVPGRAPIAASLRR